MSRLVLGIDFGTSKTIVARKVMGVAAQDPYVVELDGREITPTALLLSPAAEVEAFGQEAFDAYSDPELRPRTFLHFKRLMGHEDARPFESSAGVSLRAEDLAVLFLTEIRKALERGRNGSKLDPDTVTVIGYPASWSPKRQQTIVDAARSAGFPNVEGCEEPLAALNYHHYRSELVFDKEQRVLVFDAGGGTTDLCMATTRGGGSAPEVLATCGCNVAGADIDDALTGSFAERAGATDPNDVATIRSAARVCKEELPNTWMEEHAKVTKKFRVFLAGLLRPFSAEITRDDFESACRTQLGAMLAEIPRILKKSGQLRSEQVEVVVLAGGLGRLFSVQRGLRKKFRSSQVLVSPTPQKVIALGLVLYGLKKTGPFNLRAPDSPEGSDFAPKDSPEEDAANQSDPLRSRRSVLATIGLGIVCVAGVGVAYMKYERVQTQNKKLIEENKQLKEKQNQDKKRTPPSTWKWYYYVLPWKWF